MSLVSVRLSVPAGELAFGRVLYEGEATPIEFPRFVPMGSPRPRYFWAEPTDTAAFEERVGADDSVTTIAPADHEDGRCLYHIEWADTTTGPFFRVLRDHDIVVEEASGNGGRWQFVLLAPDRQEVTAFREALGAEGVPNTVEAVWEPRRAARNRYGLTTKQREALELAFAEGYFETPPKTNLSTLAGKLGISRQSYSRRVSRGLRCLLVQSDVCRTANGQ